MDAESFKKLEIGNKVTLERLNIFDCSFNYEECEVTRLYRNNQIKIKILSSGKERVVGRTQII